MSVYGQVILSQKRSFFQLIQSFKDLVGKVKPNLLLWGSLQHSENIFCHSVILCIPVPGSRCGQNHALLYGPG